MHDRMQTLATRGQILQPILLGQIFRPMNHNVINCQGNTIISSVEKETIVRVHGQLEEDLVFFRNSSWEITQHIRNHNIIIVSVAVPLEREVFIVERTVKENFANFVAEGLHL